jgi:hypothetical protein
MIDFDQVVLAKCEDIFSIVVSFTPLTSNPGAPAFTLRGIYSSDPYDVEMENGSIFSDQQTSLGIRFRDFPGGIVPDRGDLVEMTDSRHPSFGKRYWIGDVDEDGQGGAKLLLRTQQPHTDPS